MDMRNAFPGAHLKATEMAGPMVLTIAAVVMDKVGDDTKPVVKFYEIEQDLVLNKTNSETLIDMYGPESNGWVGRQVQLYPTKTQFGAKMVDAIRVQAPGAPAASIAPPTAGPGLQYPPQQPGQPLQYAQPTQPVPPANPAVQAGYAPPPPPVPQPGGYAPPPPPAAPPMPPQGGYQQPQQPGTPGSQPPPSWPQQ